MRLSQDRQFALVGLVHLDNEANALAYLRKAGNPFRAAVAADASGTLAAALGQRGVPASYVIDRQARIAARLPGALSDERVRNELLPALRLAMAAPGGSIAATGRPRLRL